MDLDELELLELELELGDFLVGEGGEVFLVGQVGFEGLVGCR